MNKKSPDAIPLHPNYNFARVASEATTPSMSNKSRPSSSNGKNVTHVRVQENIDLVNLETETASTSSEAPDELTFSETLSQSSTNDDLNSISTTPTIQRRARNNRERVGSEAPEHVKVEVNEPWTKQTKVDNISHVLEKP